MKSIDLSETVIKSTGGRTRAKVLKQLALDKKEHRAKAIVGQAKLEARRASQAREEASKRRAKLLSESI